jgi:hypothetical protein
MQLGNLAQLFRFAGVGFLWMVGYFRCNSLDWKRMKFLGPVNPLGLSLNRACAQVLAGNHFVCVDVIPWIGKE